MLQWMDLICILIWQTSEKEHLWNDWGYMNTHWILMILRNIVNFVRHDYGVVIMPKNNFFLKFLSVEIIIYEWNLCIWRINLI